MKKFLSILWTIFVVIVVIIAVSMMIFTIVSVNTFDKTNRDVFGYKFFIAQSDSMAATDFDAGDIVIVKEVDPFTLKEGDVITFVSQNSYNYGETVTHKIREVQRLEDGGVGFVTYGTTTNTDDEALATIIIGKYVGRLPYVGTFFTFLKTTPGYILCILVPFLILIISQIVSTIKLFRQYKKEQTAEIEAERALLEKEREESQKMMAELLALKAQLSGEAPPTATAPPTAAPVAPVTPAAPAEEAPVAAPAEEISAEATETPVEEAPAAPKAVKAKVVVAQKKTGSASAKIITKKK